MESKTQVKNIHSGHRKRVKENVCKNGFSQFEDHKLLELLLFYAIPQADTNELAHNLLNEFGTFEELVKADINRLKRVKGVGDNTAVLIATVGEVYYRALKSKRIKKTAYKTPDDFKALAVSYLCAEKVEKIYIFCMDSAGKLKKAVELSSGDESSSYIDFRKALQVALDCDAKKVVFAHNHPNGDCEPSPSDMDSTRSICVTFRRLGILIIDHIIIGHDDSVYSMYEDPKLQMLFN